MRRVEKLLMDYELKQSILRPASSTSSGISRNLLNLLSTAAFVLYFPVKPRVEGLLIDSERHKPSFSLFFALFASTCLLQTQSCLEKRRLDKRELREIGGELRDRIFTPRLLLSRYAKRNCTGIKATAGCKSGPCRLSRDDCIAKCSKLGLHKTLITRIP